MGRAAENMLLRCMQVASCSPVLSQHNLLSEIHDVRQCSCPTQNVVLPYHLVYSVFA